MRVNILVLALMSAATTAQAGSIDAIRTGRDTIRSVEKISCENCVKAAPKKAESAVELAPGTQKIEIRDVDGVKKIYRTEAWLGGSPVTFVSKVLPDDPAAAENRTVKEAEVAAVQPAIDDQPAETAEANMIDEKSTTAAVAADMGAEAKVETMPKVGAFDPDRLALRLN